MMASGASAQTSRGAKASKSPRALGLIEMTNGKARLIPIVILIDGQYFDASAYKASPVPMALWGDTVYEGIRTGVSQGLFTVKSALEKPETHQWLGEGTWLPASEIRPKVASKSAPAIPRGMNEDEGPPVLRHAGAKKPTAPDAGPAAAPTPPSPQPAQPAPATKTSGRTTGKRNQACGAESLSRTGQRRTRPETRHPGAQTAGAVDGHAHQRRQARECVKAGGLVLANPADPGNLSGRRSANRVLTATP